MSLFVSIGIVLWLPTAFHALPSLLKSILVAKQKRHYWKINMGLLSRNSPGLDCAPFYCKQTTDVLILIKMSRFISGLFQAFKTKRCNLAPVYLRSRKVPHPWKIDCSFKVPTNRFQNSKQVVFDWWMNQLMDIFKFEIELESTENPKIRTMHPDWGGREEEEEEEGDNSELCS